MSGMNRGAGRSGSVHRWAVGVAAVVVGAWLVAGPTAGVSAQPTPSTTLPADSSVRVTFTPSSAQGPCVSFPVGVQHTPQNSPTTFVLKVVVTRPLCQSVKATAAIYSMNQYPNAWPQTLFTTSAFTLQAPGTTVVEFTKGCRPVQFDVVTGATPQVISPTGQWHGPLLFPFDTSTALQWGGCPTPFTTTSSSTTTTSTTTSTTTTTTTPTTTSSTTSSTTTPSTSTTVPGTTTTVPGSTTTVPVDVAGETTVPTSRPADVAGIQQTNQNLAFTGVGPLPTILGASLIGFGLFLMLVGRRPVGRR